MSFFCCIFGDSSVGEAPSALSPFELSDSAFTNQNELFFELARRTACACVGAIKCRHVRQISVEMLGWFFVSCRLSTQGNTGKFACCTVRSRR
jgi:hypothetical protein